VPPAPSEWTRFTERFRPGDLSPESHDLVAATAELHGIGTNPLGSAAAAVRTRSEPAGRGGLFRRRLKTNVVEAVIAPPPLILIAGEEGERPHVSLYALDQIEVAEFSSPLIEDTGVEVTGFTLGATGERATRFLPLERNPAGNDFRRALTDAVAAA
jgi:hypothetical protein